MAPLLVTLVLCLNLCPMLTRCSSCVGDRACSLRQQRACAHVQRGEGEALAHGRLFKEQGQFPVHVGEASAAQGCVQVQRATVHQSGAFREISLQGLPAEVPHHMHAYLCQRHSHEGLAQGLHELRQEAPTLLEAEAHRARSELRCEAPPTCPSQDCHAPVHPEASHEMPLMARGRDVLTRVAGREALHESSSHLWGQADCGGGIACCCQVVGDRRFLLTAAAVRAPAATGSCSTRASVLETLGLTSHGGVLLEQT
mmetsp:Transcript_58858/g.137029  ORF Transcript_58858/g.137029 Transcript_58858/m.137029 type:complete len:256 (-) Transcript_58858:20-787(-)